MPPFSRYHNSMISLNFRAKLDRVPGGVCVTATFLLQCWKRMTKQPCCPVVGAPLSTEFRNFKIFRQSALQNEYNKEHYREYRNASNLVSFGICYGFVSQLKSDIWNNTASSSCRLGFYTGTASNWCRNTNFEAFLYILC